MGWLNEHMDEFVRPTMAENGWRELHKLEEVPLGYFDSNELTVMKNAWRSIKRAAGGQTILLPGRDVWCFEVLARREGYPTVFEPACSRMTVAHFAETRPEWQDLFLFDTGFAGSIPRAIGSKSWALLSHGQYDKTLTKQAFPHLTWSRGFALRIEETPKYWESGRLVNVDHFDTKNKYADVTITSTNNFKQTVTLSNGEEVSKLQLQWYLIQSETWNTYDPKKDSIVYQPTNRLEEFIRAVGLTVEIYKGSSPKFINHHRPMGRRNAWSI